MNDTLPTELYPLPVDPTYSPEQKLLLALIVRAILDALSNDPEVSRDALSFLYPEAPERDEDPFSFHWCALHLFDAPDGFKEHVRAYVAVHGGERGMAAFETQGARQPRRRLCWETGAILVDGQNKKKCKLRNSYRTKRSK